MAKLPISTSQVSPCLSTDELNALADRLADHADCIVNVAAHEMEHIRTRLLRY